MKNEIASLAPSHLVATLLEMGRIDTLYRDLYLQRARILMEAILPREEYLRHKQEQASIDAVHRQLRFAIDHSDWQRVQELTTRLQFLRSEVEREKELMASGRLLYDQVAEVPIDPFSPGLQIFSGVAPEKQGELLRQTLDKLGLLEVYDPTGQKFYAGRHAAIQDRFMEVVGSGAVKERITTSGELQQEALQALDEGNLERLAQLTRKLQEIKPDREDGIERPGKPSADLLFAFSADTLAKARTLGMTAARVETRPQFAYLLHHAWSPNLLEEENGQTRLQHLTFQADLPEALRNRLELYMIHPFITSGGTRLLPSMVAEDFLVEDFPEPAEKETVPGSALLSALGFETRRWLTRIDIERALIEYGPGIVKDSLGLEPEQFRLMCIPSDLHCRLGTVQGWGQQPVWTHFDGYQIMKGGKLQALGGGDVRFGGIYDMVSFGREYAQERIIARFAVVQRARMVSWSG